MTNEKMARLRKRYDQFETKDMSFDDFVKAFTKLSAPVSKQEIMDVQKENEIEKARADSNRILTRNKGLILPSNLN